MWLLLSQRIHLHGLLHWLAVCWVHRYGPAAVRLGRDRRDSSGGGWRGRTRRAATGIWADWRGGNAIRALAAAGGGGSSANGC